MASLNATVGITTAPFKRGLDEMRAETQKWGGDLKSTIAGAFAFSAVSSFVGNFMSEMDRIAKISARFGQSTETMQRLGHVASLAGSDLEMVAKVMTKLTIEAGKSSDKFEALGINASDFAAAGFDQQVLMLADAYEAANGDVEKQIALMTLLGTKGQDILPLLATGAAELRKQFAGVATVAPQVISAIEMMNDSMDDFTQGAKASLGATFGLMAHLGAAAAAVVQIFSKGGSWSENYNKNIEPLLDQTPTGGNTRKGMGENDDDRKQAADDAKQSAQAAAELDAELLKIARSRMDAEQKIADLKREQAQLATVAKDKTQSDEKRLDAAKKVLEIQQQIEAGEAETAKKKKQLEEAQNKQQLDKMDPEERLAELQRQQKELNDAADANPGKQSSIDKKIEATRMQGEIDAAQKEVERKQQEGSKAEGALAEEQNKQRLAKLDPLDRIRELKRQQKELNDEAARDPDKKSAAEKKLQALKLNDAIDAAQQEGEKKSSGKPSVVSSSLASIGGGGRAYIGADPALSESRRQTGLLQQLVRIASSQGSGSASLSSRNPF